MATTQDIQVNPSGWFEARYPGRCAIHGDPFPEGALVRYTAESRLIFHECCGLIFESDPMWAEVSPDNKHPHPVMPPGRTKADKCRRCFLIHTAAQGDECQ